MDGRWTINNQRTIEISEKGQGSVFLFGANKELGPLHLFLAGSIFTKVGKRKKRKNDGEKKKKKKEKFMRGRGMDVRQVRYLGQMYLPVPRFPQSHGLLRTRSCRRCCDPYPAVKLCRCFLTP